LESRLQPKADFARRAQARDFVAARGEILQQIVRDERGRETVEFAVA
jgi:hypothetical protein